MAYSAPELLLVGAAQNLVLSTSFDKEPTVCNQTVGVDHDFGVEYNLEPTW